VFQLELVMRLIAFGIAILFTFMRHVTLLSTGIGCVYLFIVYLYYYDTNLHILYDIDTIV